MLSLAKQCDLATINHETFAIGQYTRIPCNIDQSATLDYILTSENAKAYYLHVDEQRQIIDSSDHVSITAKFILGLHAKKVSHNLKKTLEHKW